MEATVNDAEDGEEEIEDEEDAELDEDEEFADSVHSHTQLNRIMQDESRDNWDSFLDRARRGASSMRRNIGSGVFSGGAFPRLPAGEEEEVYRLKATDVLWEIGCRVGYEEAVAFKVMMQQTTDSSSQKIPKAIVARASIPGRIYAEIDTFEGAQRLASAITELFPSIIRKVPEEERLQILGTISSTHSWSRVRGRKKAWISYKGDTGLVTVFHGKKSLVLIPRIAKSDDDNRAPQELASREALVAKHGPQEVTGPPGSHFSFQGQKFTKEGFLIVDLDDIDVIPRTDALPTTYEFDLFRLCPLLSPEVLEHTSSAILHKLLKPGDRVRIVGGDYRGLIGTIIEVFEDEVEVYIPSQDVAARIVKSGVRAEFRIGDEVIVVEGQANGFVGWVTEIFRDGMRVCDVPNGKEVNAKLQEMRFYFAPHLAAIPRTRKRTKDSLGGKDPNAVYIGKQVLVVGPHRYKGYRGLIKGTSPDGSAWVELEACQQRVEQLSLSDLAIQPLRGRLRALEGHIEGSGCLLGVPPSLPPEAPSTPMPSPSTSTLSPAWDPSSSTPNPSGQSAAPSPTWGPSSTTPRRPQHWLEDPCLTGMRVKLHVQGGQPAQIMEFMGVVGDSARIRDGTTIKLIDLERVERVPPTEKDNLVTILSGDLKGKVLKVRELNGNDCVVRIPGKKLRKNEEYPSFPASSLIQVFPTFR